MAHFATSAEEGTQKCADAISKGVAIVNEAWVRARANGAAPAPALARVSVPAVAAPAPAAKKAPAAAKGKKGDEEALEGLVFAITGMIPIPRACLGSADLGLLQALYLFPELNLKH